MVKCWYAEGLSKNNGRIQVSYEGLGAPQCCFLLCPFVSASEAVTSQGRQVAISTF